MPVHITDPGYWLIAVAWIQWISWAQKNLVIGRLPSNEAARIQYRFKTWLNGLLRPKSWTKPNPNHRIDTQPEVQLRILGRRHLPSKRAWKVFYDYTEDVDVVFTKNNSPFSTLERGQWIRVLCNSSCLYKQKHVTPKPLASKIAAVKKVGQKNGEVSSCWAWSILLYGILAFFSSLSQRKLSSRIQ